jgi:hypothetical protein
MSSRTPQRASMGRGALLVGLMCMQWGCAQIIGADFSDPQQTGGAGGGTSSASSSGSGSANSSGSGSANSSGSGDAGGCGQVDTVCGPDGDDANCDGVVGDCATKSIFVGLLIVNNTCSDQATDAYMTDNLPDLDPGGFTLVNTYKVFSMPRPNTKPLNFCKSGGKNQGTLGVGTEAGVCTPTSTNFRILGYVAMQRAAGYGQLSQLDIKGGYSGIVFDPMRTEKVCCHASCTDVDAYVPP